MMCSSLTVEGRHEWSTIPSISLSFELSWWRKEGKEEYLYSAIYTMHSLKGPRHGSHSFTCKFHHACLSFVSVHQTTPPLTEVADIQLQLTAHLSTPEGWKAELARWRKAVLHWVISVDAVIKLHTHQLEWVFSNWTGFLPFLLPKKNLCRWLVPVFTGLVLFLSLSQQCQSHPHTAAPAGWWRQPTTRVIW